MSQSFPVKDRLKSNEPAQGAPTLRKVPCAMRGVIACVVVLAAAGTVRGQGTAGTPAAAAAAMNQHRSDLLDQCPAIAAPANATDLPIHQTVWGSAGPSVLLVHGGVQGNVGGGPATFLKQEALATMGFTVTMVDRPGFGSSPTRGDDDMVSDSVWVAQKLGNSSHLIGHSFGGGESLLAAGRRPQAVRSLILVEPGLMALLQADPESRNNPILREAARKTADAFLAAKSPGELIASVLNTMGTEPDGSPLHVSQMLQTHPDMANQVGCRLLRAHQALAAQLQQAAEEVVRAGIPVLIVTGGYNPGVDAAGEVYARILHGRHVIVKSPNHFVQQSNAPEFNRVAGDFMKQADASRASTAAAGDALTSASSPGR